MALVVGCLLAEVVVPEGLPRARVVEPALAKVIVVCDERLVFGAFNFYWCQLILIVLCKCTEKKGEKRNRNARKFSQLLFELQLKTH